MVLAAGAVSATSTDAAAGHTGTVGLAEGGGTGRALGLPVLATIATDFSAGNGRGLQTFFAFAAGAPSAPLSIPVSPPTAKAATSIHTTAGRGRAELRAGRLFETERRAAIETPVTK
jgi:hypothetical protein